MTDAKTFFRKIRLERREIRILSERIHIRELSLLPSGIRYDKTDVQTSIEDKMSEKLAEISDYELKRQKLLQALMLRQSQAIDIISGIPDTKQRQIMEIYYLDSTNPTWQDVADEMILDRRYVLRLHGEALNWINEHASIN